LLVSSFRAPSAAVIDAAVKQARQLCQRRRAAFVKILRQNLRAHEVLQNNGRKPACNPQPVSNYTAEGICLEGSLAELLQKCQAADAIMRSGAPFTPGMATMLFYGPPGTGKTALARYIAGQLQRECMVKRASDIVSMWAGETEKNIASAFYQAEREGAVLLIDEVDSFLFSRDTAAHSWESRQVNEFLTALEECLCFCICSTNRREKMDAAAMRRFSFKAAFGYAQPEQIMALYHKLLTPLAQGPLSAAQRRDLLNLKRLTPGDFHAVRAQYGSLFSLSKNVSHTDLVAALAQESALKLGQEKARAGF
jgi:SpoVK/Ycf46/Vps4 family AAA+-type ATPase